MTNGEKARSRGHGEAWNEIRKGDVFWLDFGPLGGSAPADRHPCVVVQSDLFNASRLATTVVCLITSNLTRAEAPGNVPLRKGEASLPKASVVNVTQIQTVDKSDLVERIGRLPADTVSRIQRGLRLMLDGV